MNTEELAYLKTSEKPFDALLEAVEAAAAKRNFRVLHKHNIQATLAEKDLELTPYTVVEVCNGGFAHKILTSNKEVGMMLPCRMAVYEKEGVNHVLLMKPSLINTMMSDADFGSIPEDVEKILIEAVDEAVA
jgi:uncharacterized protein (DUF302 family)